MGYVKMAKMSAGQGQKEKDYEEKTTPPKKGYRDIEVLYVSGNKCSYRMYSEMYERTLEHLVGIEPNVGRFAYVVAYILEQNQERQKLIPAMGKSYINLRQVCTIDIIGCDNERTE